MWGQSQNNFTYKLERSGTNLMSLILFAKDERHLMGKVQTSLEEEIPFLRVMHPLHTIKNNCTLSLWLSIRCKLLWVTKVYFRPKTWNLWLENPTFAAQKLASLKTNSQKNIHGRSQGWNRKNIFNLPQVTNKCWTLWPCIGPKAEKKRILLNLGSQFATLGADVPAFINILTLMF